MDDVEGTIQWNDAQVADLLDRTKEGIADVKDVTNDYLSSFKVASYVVKAEEEEEEEEVSLACPCHLGICFMGATSQEISGLVGLEGGRGGVSETSGSGL